LKNVKHTSNRVQKAIDSGAAKSKGYDRREIEELRMWHCDVSVVF
jgi:hypothetical protein